MRNLDRFFVMCGLSLLFGLSFGCKNESKSTDDITNLLLLQTIANSSSKTTTIYNSSGVAGRNGFLSLSDITRSSGTLTVNGVSIPVTCCSTSSGVSSVTFTTPVFSDVTENTKFDAIFVSSAGVSYSGSFYYYVLPTITENIPNSFNRTIPFGKVSDLTIMSTHYYKYTPSTTVTLANISGYTGNSTLSIGFTNPTSTTDFRTFSSSTNFANAAFLKITSTLTAGTTYDLKITNYGSTTVAYKIGVVNQAISNGASCNIHTTHSRCLDYLVNDSASQADCVALGTYNAAQTCTGLALGTVVGRCTAPSGTNIATVYYYSNGGAAFNAGTAATDCSSKSSSIFQ